MQRCAGFAKDVSLGDVPLAGVFGGVWMVGDEILEPGGDDENVSEATNYGLGEKISYGQQMMLY